MRATIVYLSKDYEKPKKFVKQNKGNLFKRVMGMRASYAMVHLSNETLMNINLKCQWNEAKQKKRDRE